MKEEEKIAAGILFCPTDEELKKIKLKTHNLNVDFNNLHEDEKQKRWEILNKMLGEIGEGSFLQGPITFHYGKHTKIGKHTFINFNFTVQDDASVIIGDHCDIGPNVTIVTPLHPMLANERRSLCDKDGNKKRLCYAEPVKIGSGCWICANVIICPGVVIGNNTVVGAGSVVIRDIPANSFAAGAPCKVIRALTQADSLKRKPEILADNQIL